MSDVYEVCPVFENKQYLLRLVKLEDSMDLLAVYSDAKSVPLFNSDNCHGDDFYYTTSQRMQTAIEYWLWEYARKGFVRWSIVDKAAGKAVGTVEAFRRVSKDAFDGNAILRLDLGSDYERQTEIASILTLIVPSIHHLFACHRIATKAIPSAKERIAAMTAMGFAFAQQPLIGHDGTQYGDYYVSALEG